MLYYKLDNINPQKVINDLIKLINSQNTDRANSVLVIRINQITSDDNTMIPKLEFKNT
jgi:hypothetical protein